VKGLVGLGSGIGLMIFLYYFAAALILKIPPQALKDIPFELEPVLHVLWLVGLIPALSGAGRLVAGLLMKAPKREEVPYIEAVRSPNLGKPEYDPSTTNPVSVTENTTSLLEPQD
ncbi:MAG: hypothetical protein ABJB97_03535, partial [Acidobacteriota bacterium]